MRGGLIRISDHGAIASSIERLASDVGEGGRCVYSESKEKEGRGTCPRRSRTRAALDVRLQENSKKLALPSPLLSMLNAALRSFWRRFWNHMIRKLGSESSSQAGTSCSLREEWELGSVKGSDG